ncbi:trypsin-like peptidase domain-containing protein [Streptomyces sp. NPDC020719]|uniref:VMAP-C domain-containing protein n=1 Tax=unclassified Streptomyces TaxID=2593676 RepID=UPI0033FE0E87
MASPSWPAYISCGGAVGAGFLFTDRHVLTCAHVVWQEERAEIRLPGLAGHEPVLARVVARGGWAGDSRDPGDWAVLELPGPVPVRPARFARLDAPYAYPAPKLLAHGFPEGYEEGLISELRASTHQLTGNEWTQLEDWKGYGASVSGGFSGSAVSLADGGEVVGMVCAMEPVRMVSAHVLARSWPPLAEHVPTPGHDPGEKRALAALVARVPDGTADPDRLFGQAVGPLGLAPPDGGFANVWEAVWHLLAESAPRAGAFPLAEFAVRLATAVDEGPSPDAALGRELRAWAQAYRARRDAPAGGAGGPGRAPDLGWSPVLVDINRSGEGRNALLVEVYAYRDGTRRLVDATTVTGEKQLRDWVLDRVDDAFGDLDDRGRALVAFALPRTWLNKPVDQWVRRKGIEPPLGCVSPVVVMDRLRRRNPRLQWTLRQMWDVLDGRRTSPVHRIECGAAPRPDKLSVQLQDVYGPVGFARPPDPGRAATGPHGAALDAPSPIVLWPHTGCAGASCDGGCRGSGFLDALAERLTRLAPGELPGHVLTLRKEAFVHDEDAPHWAAGLTLVWEDPRRFPPVTPPDRSPLS